MLTTPFESVPREVKKSALEGRGRVKVAGIEYGAGSSALLLGLWCNSAQWSIWMLGGMGQSCSRYVEICLNGGVVCIVERTHRWREEGVCLEQEPNTGDQQEWPNGKPSLARGLTVARRKSESRVTGSEQLGFHCDYTMFKLRMLDERERILQDTLPRSLVS